MGRAVPSAIALADLGEPAQTDPAGDRLAARLVGAVADQEAGEVHDAGGFVGDDDGTRADVGAGVAQGAERVGRVEELRGQEAAASARRPGAP